MPATGKTKMHLRGFLPAISYAMLNDLSALNEIKNGNVVKESFTNLKE